jgi:hypothetical protein
MVFLSNSSTSNNILPTADKVKIDTNKLDNYHSSHEYRL